MLTTGGTALQRVERFEEGVWRAIHAVKPATLGQVASVAPGATRRDVAVLNLLRGTMPALSPDEVAGAYRALYLVFATWNPALVGGPPGELLPDPERTSDPFTVHPPEP